MTDDWPTLQQELSRKTVAELQRWVELHHQGKISDRELFIITKAMWNCVSGLVEVDVQKLIADLNEHIRFTLKIAAQRK